MRTVGTPRIICEHCGVDFTERSYSDRICHQNATSDWNMEVFTNRMKRVSVDMLYEMKDHCSVEVGVGYDTSMEIAKCLIRNLRNGISVGEGKEKKFPEIANFMENNLPKIKEWYSELYQSKIDKIKEEAKIAVNDYTEMLNALPK
jgi:hypothetical protein